MPVFLCGKITQMGRCIMTQTDSAAADVIVIGGGPGGYVAAIRAAQLGGKVILVEKDNLGGVCLNRGCIPTKAMLSAADVYDTVANRSAEYGVTVSGVSVDYMKIVERRQKVVKTLVSGVGYLMKKNNIQVKNGAARLTSATSVEVTGADGSKETVSAKNIIIASGSEPVKVPIPGLEGENVLDSDGALAANSVPRSILIIGGGAIGLEWAYIFKKLGSDVTLVELMEHILPQNDAEIANELARSLKKAGIKIMTGHKVTGVETKGGMMVSTVTDAAGAGAQQIESEKILVAVGRRPVSGGMGLEELGVKTERGRILVNDRMETSIPGIYAIGDVTGGMLLAHKASEEGVVASENIMGKSTRMNYNVVPAAVYTSPEVATVGLSEEAVKAKGIDYKVGRFQFRPNGKALALGENEGMVKIIADARYGEVLGCHMVGPHVTDMIHEIVIAMESEATVETIGRAIHAHPTLSEVVKEAALDVYGEAIHKA
jgi:dihydrolipoamide dehydrogenase